MEIWKPLRNFPNYSGSTEGRIMNVRTQHVLTPVKDYQGRMTVCLRKNNKWHTVKVRKVIAETFLGEHHGMDIRHKDGDQLNTKPDNLEWCNRRDTIVSAYERGSKKANNHTRIKVVETEKIYNSIAECATDLKCNKSSISKCLSGKLSHVKGYHFVKVP